MKFFWGLLLLATAVVSLKIIAPPGTRELVKAHEERGIRELSERDNDIIKKSKEIKQALEVDHREPTFEERAVLAQWERGFDNKQDELKAAGSIDRRALLSLIGSSLKRRAPIRTDLDRNLRENSARKFVVNSRETGDKRALTDDQISFILKAKAIAEDLDQKKREPTEEEEGILLTAAFLALANEKELKEKGIIPKEGRAVANQARFISAGKRRIKSTQLVVE